MANYTPYSPEPPTANYQYLQQQCATVPFSPEPPVREGAVDGERIYLDGTVSAAETRDNAFEGMPADSYSIMLTIATDHDPKARVFLEVSTRMGRSEYTCDRQQWQLALESLRRIDPNAGDNELAYPERLVGKPCRLLGVWKQGKGRWCYYLVKQGEGAEGQPTPLNDAAARLARMKAKQPTPVVVNKPFAQPAGGRF